jgi:hypothetical protein
MKLSEGDGVLVLRMNVKSRLPITLAALSAISVAGCISHHETVYRDVERLPISFENDSAARNFYEALERRRKVRSGNETRTEFHIPVVFDHEVKTVTGPNSAFNDAVRAADTDRDGKITEQEARIFADQNR